MPETPPMPLKLDLKKDERLRIEWADGATSTFPVGYLRQMCPCANCRMLREGRDPHQLMQPAPPADADRAGHDDTPPPPQGAAEQQPAPAASPSQPRRSMSLGVLPSHFVSRDQGVRVESAEMVGHYALKLTFTDGHDTGIFSFAYLRQLPPPPGGG